MMMAMMWVGMTMMMTMMMTMTMMMMMRMRMRRRAGIKWYTASSRAYWSTRIETTTTRETFSFG